jgi:MOSC domain-containing protein
MPLVIGHIEALFRYPVKSMAGERLESAILGWHGIEGDRRLAFRRMGDHTGMPWLTASRLPELLLYTPIRQDSTKEIPTHVRTPDGNELPIFGEELAADVERRYGNPVQMLQFKNGIFDDGIISVIATETIDEIGRLAGLNLDVRRFRPNVLVRLTNRTAFQEDGWLGGVLSFGEGDDAPSISVTVRDERCAMVNLDPDTARHTPGVMKAIVRVNQNKAGIYATVTRTGILSVGQPIFLHRASNTIPR